MKIPTSSPMRTARWRMVAAAGALLAAAGCVGREAAPDPGATPAPAEREARLAYCEAVLRDARLACRSGIKAVDGASRMRCLDARMKLDRYCF